MSSFLTKFSKIFYKILFFKYSKTLNKNNVNLFNIIKIGGVMKKMSILVIEDKLQHLEDAKRFLNGRIKSGVAIQVDYAMNYKEAKQQLEKGSYDGILSDVFLPKEVDADIVNLENVLGRQFDNTSDEWPYGVLIGEYALANGIPIVLITDLNHHGGKIKVIGSWTYKTDVVLVDNDNTKKSWLEGYAVLMWMIIAKQKGLVEINTEGIQTDIYFSWYRGYLKGALDGSLNHSKNTAGLPETVEKYLKGI